MCRLAYFSPAVAGIGRKYLLSFLSYLEERQGGSGNGVAVLPKSGLAMVSRGIKTTVNECAAMIMSAALDGLPSIFHTRWASVGDIHAHLCHPFVSGTKIIAHNGTDMQLAILAKYFGEKGTVSDTWVFAKLLSTRGERWMRSRGLWPRDGVWIVAKKNGGGYVHRNNGTLEYCAALGVWASEFPLDWPETVYDVKAGKHDLTKVPPKAEYTWAPQKKLNESSDWNGSFTLDGHRVTIDEKTGKIIWLKENVNV